MSWSKSNYGTRERADTPEHDHIDASRIIVENYFEMSL